MDPLALLRCQEYDDKDQGAYPVGIAGPLKWRYCNILQAYFVGIVPEI